MPSSLPAPINGKAVLRARLRKGWTQRDVAQRCSELGQPCDDTQISKIERELTKRPGPRILRVLADALDLDMDELLGQPVGSNGHGAA